MYVVCDNAFDLGSVTGFVKYKKLKPDMALAMIYFDTQIIYLFCLNYILHNKVV